MLRKRYLKSNRPLINRMLRDLRETNPILIIAGIILIPIGVAAASLWVDTRIDERQRQAADELFQRQEELTVTQTIDSYFQGIGMLVASRQDLVTRNRIIIARTNALLGRLTHPRDRALIIRFISELQLDLTKRPERMLERAAKPFVDLSNLDLSQTDLSYINLHGANLNGANLRGANLLWANLRQASLRETLLDQSDLRGAELSGSNLTGASLRGAQIGGTSFIAADLGNADLRDAETSDFEFEGLVTATKFDNAKLSNTIWFDGSTCVQGAIEKCKSE